MKKLSICHILLLLLMIVIGCGKEDNRKMVYIFPNSIMQIKVSHITLFNPQVYIIESDDPDLINKIVQWFYGLELIECERPADVDGNELYVFEVNGESVFEYDNRGGGMDYIIIGDAYYEVNNPSIPPPAGYEHLEFNGKRFRRYDLTPETDRWLRWYVSLSSNERIAVDDIPDELLSGE